MATVLRVKRKYTETPLDKLVVSYFAKRQKLDDSSADPNESPSTATIAHYVGLTLAEPGDETQITQHVNEFLSNRDTKVLDTGIKRSAAVEDDDDDDDNDDDDDDYDNDKSKPTAEKLPRLEKDVHSYLNNRYMVVNGQSLNNTNEKSEGKWTILDLEDYGNNETIEDQPTEENQDGDKYVYDLYYAETDINLGQNDIFVQEMVYNTNCNSESDYSWDSNAESNPQNNYPDSDEWEFEHNNYKDNYIDEEVYGSSSDDDLLDESEADRKQYGSSYKNYRQIVQCYDPDAKDSTDSDDSDESFGIL